MSTPATPADAGELTALRAMQTETDDYVQVRWRLLEDLQVWRDRLESCVRGYIRAQTVKQWCEETRRDLYNGLMQSHRMDDSSYWEEIREDFSHVEGEVREWVATWSGVPSGAEDLASEALEAARPFRERVVDVDRFLMDAQRGSRDKLATLQDLHELIKHLAASVETIYTTCGNEAQRSLGEVRTHLELIMRPLQPSRTATLNAGISSAATAPLGAETDRQTAKGPEPTTSLMADAGQVESAAGEGG